jgi:hypothetical protein
MMLTTGWRICSHSALAPYLVEEGMMVLYYNCCCCYCYHNCVEGAFQVSIRIAAQDAPLTLQQLHDLTPFFHYYISQYDLRANPLPVLHKHLVRREPHPCCCACGA